MKYILTFLLTFLFIQICELYIMGGFSGQTIHSKSISIVVGCILAVFVTAAFADISKNKSN